MPQHEDNTQNIYDPTRVYRIRQTLELSQKELAAQCYLEANKHYAPDRVSQQMADLLKTPLSWNTIHRLEANEKTGNLNRLYTLSIGSFLKLCAGLGVQPHQLWKGWPR